MFEYSYWILLVNTSELGQVLGHYSEFLINDKMVPFFFV